MSGCAWQLCGAGGATARGPQDGERRDVAGGRHARLSGGHALLAPRRALAAVARGLYDWPARLRVTVHVLRADGALACALRQAAPADAVADSSREVLGGDGPAVREGHTAALRFSRVLRGEQPVTLEVDLCPFTRAELDAALGDGSCDPAAAAAVDVCKPCRRLLLPTLRHQARRA
jgi:hypothetical protein